MSILVDESTKLCVSGITGREGTFHSLRNREYGTQVVGGVTPGKGGTTHEGWPIFDTVQDAVKQTGANASVIFVPPPFAADAVMEAADGGLALVVCITEGIPTLDMMRAMTFLKERPGTRLVGRRTADGCGSSSASRSASWPSRSWAGWSPGRWRCSPTPATLRPMPPRWCSPSARRTSRASRADRGRPSGCTGPRST